VKYLAVILFLIYFFSVTETYAEKEDRFDILFERETEGAIIGRPGREKPAGRITTEDYVKLTGEEKIEVIKKLIAGYKIRKGIIVKSPAELYVVLLDDMIERNPMLVDMPLEQVFENACMEIDDFEEE